MSKRICGQVLVLSSRRLERTAPGVYEKSEKVKMFIKSKTYNGHKNHIKFFVMHKVSSVLAERFSQDPL